MTAGRFLAIDIGAESGRGIVGTIGNGRLVLDEVHRFPNMPFRVFGHLHWNVFHLYAETVRAIGKAAAGGSLTSLGIDTWAVDYALLGPDDVLLGAPYHYRDRRVDGIMEQALAVMPAEDVYEATGIQFLPFNTLYQLMAAARYTPETLAAARSLLMIGEYVAFLLTGEKAAEFTNASTTQLLDPRTGTWSTRLFSAFDLPLHIMPAVVPPGTTLGPLARHAADETSAGAVPVVLPAVHDTGSAVAAVPVAPGTGDDWCYLSSGTWSLLGVEVHQPVLSDAAFRSGLTNEGGVAGTFRLLKNVMGLWLLQECRREWAAAGRDFSYAELAAMAAAAPPFRTVIDPDDARFLSPGNMPQKIEALARETGQPLPQSPGEFARCIFESLALKYRHVIELLEQTTGRAIRVIHVVGGGANNQFLNQVTADATGRTVLAGPVEATAIGNILVQAIGAGVIVDLKDGRELVRRTFSPQRYTPRPDDAWDDAFRRLREVMG